MTLLCGTDNTPHNISHVHTKCGNIREYSTNIVSPTKHYYDLNNVMEINKDLVHLFYFIFPLGVVKSLHQL
jgi:hypothetical protein